MTKNKLASELVRIAKSLLGYSSSSVVGKTFVLTGAMPSGKGRTEVQQTILDAGGKIKSSISRGVDYLVARDPDSGSIKNQMAQRYGIEVITEARLNSMLRGY